MLDLCKESCCKPRQNIQKQGHHFANKGPYSQSYRFSSCHVWMWELDHKEGWAHRIDVFELRCWRRLESPLDCKEIQPVHPKGDQSWVFFGRTDAEAEAPALQPPDVKSHLTGKTTMLRKIEGRRRRENEDGITNSMGVGLSKLQDIVKGREVRCAIVHEVSKCQTWLRDWTTTLHIVPYMYNFPSGSDGKEFVCNAGDLSSIPGSGRLPGEGNGNPLQYSCLGNLMDKGVWQATAHGVARSQTWLSD